MKRAIVATLAAAAVLYQGLIPAGYMIGTRADVAAGTPVVPCPAQQKVVATVAAEHAHHHHGVGHSTAADEPSIHHADSCAFAVAATAALPTTDIVPGIAALPVAGAPRLQAPALIPRTARTLPPARGPPAFT